MSAASYVAHLHVVTLLICVSSGKLSRWTEEVVETYCHLSFWTGTKRYSRKSGQTMPLTGEATRPTEGNHDKNNISSSKVSLCEEFVLPPLEKEVFTQKLQTKYRADKPTTDKLWIRYNHQK
jgi:hypothetical protein